ncbi:hypothetical protein [Niallia endozanthoxylica]|uniref:Uncharacterized protein n=1 Tax=Niallia endozanthoxylica TaxID=2036016 RepID=A0A5J5GV16_9BACI|nr:hypothetical protein [Niallia endozanthoxylica]KAA9012121.1 hypothetical protein F4V44_26100 [Niallia endozanthoxylica]
MMTKGSSLKLESKRTIKEQVMNEIINLIIMLDITELNGWEDIEFDNIDYLKTNSSISLEELFVLKELLEHKYEEMLYQMHLEEYYLQ